MGIVDKFIDGMTKRKLKAIVVPASEITDEVPLTTSRRLKNHAYMVSLDKVKLSPNNNFTVKLPKRSNIDDVITELDKIKKEVKGEKLSTRKDDYMKIAYIDRVNRHYAMKVETPEHITISIRGDVANLLFLKGWGLIQCDDSNCTMLIPGSLKVDFKKYVARDPTDRKVKMASKEYRDFSSVCIGNDTVKNTCKF